MDFSLSTEQDILKRSAREFLAAECKLELAKGMASDQRGIPADLWQKIADLGWTALPFPDKYGGADGSILDLIVLLEEMGRAHMPGPFFTSVILGGMAILEAASEDQKLSLLPAIAAGDKIATLALLESTFTYEPSGITATAVASSSGYAVTGSKLFVPDAHLADYVVCAARTGTGASITDGISLLLVHTEGGNAPGITVNTLETMSGEKQFELIFDRTPAELLGAEGTAWPAITKVLQVAATGKCAEMVGAAQRALDLAVEQGHNRVQFGRPIGSFQAIQHHCANMLSDIDLSRFLTHQAGWMLAEGKPSARPVSAAKSFVSDAYLRVCQYAHQVLGGNGLIDEHEMPLISKRALANHQLFGSPDFHREIVVRELGV